MHWLDRVVGTLVAPRKSSLRLFHDGWGDPDLYAYFRYGPLRAPVDFGVEVRWDRSLPGRADRVWDGQFTSPAPHLPPTARTSHVRLLVPDGPCRRVCVLMSAWNDHGFAARLPLARRLAGYGIATLMFENPYFGRRRPLGNGHPVATVVDFAVMAYASVNEGRAVVAWLGDHGLPGRDGEPITIGVAGFSMGGNIAGAISATAPFPVATAALAASHSPGPLFSEGVMSLVVDWDALDDRPEHREELVTFLTRLSVLNYPAPAHAPQAVLLAGRADGFIPIETVLAFHHHWEGSELRWTNEGHATLRFLRSPSLGRTVRDAFDRFEEAYGVPGG